MSKIYLELEEGLLEESNQVFNHTGLDLPIAIKIFLKRVVREQSISFLFQNDTSLSLVKEKETISSIDRYVAEDKGFSQEIKEEKIVKANMTKNMAIRLFKSKGYNVGENVTFASKNRGAYNYWANPDFELLNSDWNLILNDWMEKKIYLFTIPANSISRAMLSSRSDRDLIDLQIMYGDPTFTDNRSGYSFAKYLVDEINY